MIDDLVWLLVIDKIISDICKQLDQYSDYVFYIPILNSNGIPIGSQYFDAIPDKFYNVEHRRFASFPLGTICFIEYANHKYGLPSGFHITNGKGYRVN